MAGGRPAVIDVAAAVLEDSQRRVLITQRRPGTHMAGWWEFPGGKLRPGELPSDGLARELAEEIGVTVESAEPLIQIDHDYPDRPVRLHVYRITRWRGTAAAREGQALRWLTVQELVSLPAFLPADRPAVERLLGQ